MAGKKGMKHYTTWTMISAPIVRIRSGLRMSPISRRDRDSFTIRHPGPVRSEHYQLSYFPKADGKSCSGYDQGSEEKRKGHWWTRTPQWSMVSIHFTGVFQPDTSVSHFPVHVRRGNPFENALGENVFCFFLKTNITFKKMVLLE